jgi:hypothetical protein
VRLLDKIDDPTDPQTRDEWWTDIREEMRSHARALGCNSVIGYMESTSISDNVLLLNATGAFQTVLFFHYASFHAGTAADIETANLNDSSPAPNLQRSASVNTLPEDGPEQTEQEAREPSAETSCSILHMPRTSVGPTVDDAESFSCQICNRPDANVPDFLFATSILFYD